MENLKRIIEALESEEVYELPKGLSREQKRQFILSKSEENIMKKIYYVEVEELLGEESYGLYDHLVVFFDEDYKILFNMDLEERDCMSYFFPWLVEAGVEFEHKPIMINQAMSDINLLSDKVRDYLKKL